MSEQVHIPLEVVTGDGRHGEVLFPVPRKYGTLAVPGVPVKLPIPELLQPNGLALTGVDTSGTFSVVLASNTLLARGKPVQDALEVSVCWAQYTLPPLYLTAGDVLFRLTCKLEKTANGQDNGSEVRLAVYEQAFGVAGPNLCVTGGQTFPAVGVWTEMDFVVNPRGLVAGDVLNLEITARVREKAGGGGPGTLRVILQPPGALVDLRAIV